MTILYLVNLWADILYSSIYCHSHHLLFQTFLEYVVNLIYFISFIIIHHKVSLKQIDFYLLCNYPFSLLVSTYCLVWLHSCSSLCYPCTGYLWTHFMTFILPTHFTLSLLCFSLFTSSLTLAIHFIFSFLSFFFLPLYSITSFCIN